MGAPSEGTQHLFIVRIWTDPGQSPPRLTRGLIEHIPSGERRYFLEWSEMQAFLSGRLATFPLEKGTGEDPLLSAGQEV